MAALESIALLLQVIRNLEGLRRDMRANAKSYKANLAAGRTPAQVAIVMEQDAREYRKRLDWLDPFRVPGTKRDVLLNGFQRVGVVESDAVDILTELDPVITAQFNLSTSTPTAAQINNGMDTLLATVPPHQSLWPDAGTATEPT